MTNKPSERGKSSPLPESHGARGRIEEPVSAGGVVYRLADGKVDAATMKNLLQLHQQEVEVTKTKIRGSADVD